MLGTIGTMLDCDLVPSGKGPEVIVLGIHDGHDAGASLVADGRVLCVSSEERRRNSKNFAGVPERSIEAVLSFSGVHPKDVDLVALAGTIRTTNPTRGEKPAYKLLRNLYSIARSEAVTKIGQWALSKVRKRGELLGFLAERGLSNVPLQAYDHHRTHAATAYFFRPWEGDATVLTLDGAGDGLCATVSTGRGTSMDVIARTPKFHSPAAHMYSAMTEYLGMKPSEHEYKLMGLAPYGQHERSAEVFRSMFSVRDLRFHNDAGRIGPSLLKHYAQRLKGLRFDDIAAGCQRVFEELLVQWVRNAVTRTGVNRVAAAGGAFLNVKANKLVRESGEVDCLYVYPACDDGGTALGAALLGWLDLAASRGSPANLALSRDMYLGLSHEDAEMEKCIRESGLPFVRPPNLEAEAAKALAGGSIVGCFRGREEFGPRALGNRSILADPRELRTVRKLNFAIKHRDFWMPFACSILEEDGARYLKRPTAWPYWMVEAFDTTPDGWKDLAAALHPFDLTARPQLVNEMNPPYRQLLREFRKLTGVGALLNTSFNLHGFPIVGHPQTALSTFLQSDLDVLILGPFLVRKGPATRP